MTPTILEIALVLLVNHHNSDLIKNFEIPLGCIPNNATSIDYKFIEYEQKWGYDDMKFKPGNRWKSSKSELKYKTWRKNVFELNKAKKGLRKYYVCEKCNKRRKTTKVLHAHHKYSWNKFPTKRYDRSNGVVLCIPCHNKFHKKYKFEALDKPELLDEYLEKK